MAFSLFFILITKFILQQHVFVGGYKNEKLTSLLLISKAEFQAVLHNSVLNRASLKFLKL